MSLLWLDGFDAYGANGAVISDLMMSSGYQVAANITASSATRTGDGFAIHSEIGSAERNYTSGQIRYATGAKDTIIVGFAFRMSKHQLKHLGSFYYDDGLGHVTVQGSVWVNAQGGITLCRGSNEGVKLAESQPNLVFPYVWHYCEIRYKPHQTAGMITARIDGVSCASYSGQTEPTGLPNFTNLTGIGGCDVDYWVGNLETFSQGWYDDLYICDAGGTAFNDFLGDSVITTLFPTGDAGTNQLSIQGDTFHHFDCVDDPVPDQETSYLYGNTNGLRELFSLDDLPSNVIDVLAVAVNVRAKKAAAGNSSYKMLAQIDTDLKLSDANGLVPRWQTRQFLMESAPGGGDWTKARVDDLLVGFDLLVG